MADVNTSEVLAKSIYTLAQNETGKSPIIVQGNGSDLTNDKGLKGRAKRKMITQKMVYSLIDVAKKKESSDRQHSYWNSYHCQNKIYSSNGKYYGHYCKNRFCTLCCSIRKAHIINRYYPVIATWPEPYFVTLTAKALGKGNLAKRVRDLNRGFRIITCRNRKRAQRGNGLKLVGIKSLECNFNAVKKTYNPHLHMIVANKLMAETIISEWLELCTPKFARRPAQNMQAVTDMEKALIEIVKYGTKIFTEPDVATKSVKKADRDIYAAALDNIFTAMKGCRIFERFGFNLPKKEKETLSTLLSEYEVWEFDSKIFDWLQSESKKSFTGYQAPIELIALLQNNIDVAID